MIETEKMKKNFNPGRVLIRYADVGPVSRILSSAKASRLLLIFCGMLFTSFASAQTARTQVFKTIGEKQLKLDVYPPKNVKGSAPAIILFHGGGLIGGNKDQLKNQCLFFAERGMVAITAEYRLIPKGSPDAKSLAAQCVQDAKSAVKWVIAHAGELHVDTSRIVLGGGSAGAFLALEAALANDNQVKADRSHTFAHVRALVLYNPAFAPEFRHASPPAKYISKTSPPAVLFYGDKDRFKAGGDDFFSRLHKENIPAELWVAPGETHAFFNKPGWNTATNKKAYDFLIRIGLLKGQYEKDEPGFILNKQEVPSY